MTFPTLPMSIPRYPDCVLLCEYGDVARWKNGAVFTPDEARRLGMRLMAQADAAERADEPDRGKARD